MLDRKSDRRLDRRSGREAMEESAIQAAPCVEGQSAGSRSRGKSWKDKVLRTGAVGLTVVLAAGGVGGAVYASGASGAAEVSDVEEQVKEVLQNVWQPWEDSGEAGKEETVYALVDGSGAVRQLIVSDWIKNAGKEANILDRTELKNLTEVKNGENYTREEDNLCIWNAQGNDIYYQGEIEKDLPVSMKIVYLLDGKEINPQELAGKSGHVVIRYEFTNHQYEMRDVEGVQEKIYVPFAAVTGMILDNTQFCNITVSSGRVINDGNRSIVAGLAFPGLAESLGLTESKNFPEFVEIEADVEGFSLDAAYTLVTNKIFNNVNLDDVKSPEGLKDSMTELEDAVEALLDGTSRLYDGVAELYDKSGDLKSGAEKLNDGAKQLSEGAGSLADGAHELESGMDDLSTGLNTLDAKSVELAGGAEQVFYSLLGTAGAQLAASGVDVPALTIDNYGAVLDGVLASLDGSSVYGQVQEAVYAAVAEQVNANEGAIRAGVEQAVRGQVLSGVLAAAGLDAGQYEAMAGADPSNPAVAQIEAAVEGQMQSGEIQAAIQTAVEEQKAALIRENIEKPETQELVNAKTAEAEGQLAEGAAKIAGLKSQLDSYNTFYQGVIAYTNGVSQASTGSNQLCVGAQQLSSGADTLREGAGTLAAGTEELAQGAAKLIDGVRQLKDGALELKEGMAAFDEEGIQKLTSALDGDFEGAVDRLKAIVEVSKEYQSFAGIADDMEGSVKFIYKTDEIK